MTEIDYNTLIPDIINEHGPDAPQGLSKDAIWKILLTHKLPKKPVQSTLTLKLNKLVKANVLETVMGHYKLTKNYMQKWLKKLEGGSEGAPAVVSKSKASMKKGGAKKLASKKSTKRSSPKKKAAGKSRRRKAATKKRA